MKQSKNGNEMWQLGWVIEDGPCKGRLIFDHLVFTPAAFGRVKILYKALGLPHQGTIQCKPEHLENVRALVTVGTETGSDGKVRNKVPFDGYASLSAVQEGSAAPPADAEFNMF